MAFLSPIQTRPGGFGLPGLFFAGMPGGRNRSRHKPEKNSRSVQTRLDDTRTATTKSKEGMFVVVLVVDDESLVREIVAEDLCDDGLEVIQASTAEDALSLAEQRRALDAVVTDVHLGQGMDGIRFAAEVHRRWPETGVVIMTGQPSRLSASERACAEHLLVKPFGPSALVRAVRGVMRRDES